LTKKTLQKIFKKISYGLFFLIYGKIIKSLDSNSDNRIRVESVSKNKKIKYKIYIIKNGSLYTDRIQDTAILIDRCIIEGPSFQYRDNNLSPINNNIVFEKGTPRKLKKLNGKVLSLLTGGAGNNNYWHWIYDVLPRLALCDEIIKLSDVDYFLVPSLNKKFQLETLNELNIPTEKLLSSDKYRHIKSNELIATDHPYAISGNSTKDIHNIPSWICLWLKDKFLTNKSTYKKKLPKKIYIDRSDSTSNLSKLRALVNENEIKKIMNKNGFENVRLSDLHFADQVQLFYQADYIVGLHGAAFANLVFCRPNTKVLEFQSTTAGQVIENIAKANNLIYSSIRCEPIDYDFLNQLGHIEIPLEELQKKILNL